MRLGRWVWVFLPLAWLPSGEAALVVTGFATNLPGPAPDDAVEVANWGALAVVLDNVTIGDGEGRIAFPSGVWLGPGETVRVTTNATAYRLAARADAAFALDHPSAGLEVRRPGFSLGQSGDELLLHRGEDLLDAVVWGSSRYEGPGWSGPPLHVTGTHLRWFAREPGLDSDTAADWERPQAPRLGWRTPVLPVFEVGGAGVAYTAPDQTRSIVSGLLARAERSVRLNMYDVRDVGLAQDLLDRMAARPNLDVRVLVDASPVGLSAETRLIRERILYDWAAAGADVRLFAHDRYPYNHAKYLVVDDRFVLVQSENLVPGAHPPDARQGQRGWGVLVEDVRLAQALSALFEDDFALDPYGARAFTAGDPLPPPRPAFATQSPRPRLNPVAAQGFNVTLVVGPEAHLGSEDPLLALIASAQDELLVQQLRVPPHWRDAQGREWPNAYLNALVEAARRGVRVRLLLDGSFLDGSETDNAATARVLQPASELLPIRVRLSSTAGDVLHVKGVVVDQRVAWVGSMNWNLNSVAQNREVSLRVDAPPFAALFQEAFELDWRRAEPVESTPRLFDLPTPAAGATVITLAALALGMRRRP
jgi:cardiolipin synthase A/B